MKNDAVKDIATLFTKLGLRAQGGEGVTLKNLAIGPYVRLNNDKRKERWGSRRTVAYWVERYYEHHSPVSFGSRLMLKRLGIFGSFLVINQDTDILDLLTPKDRMKNIKSHISEFARFAAYLERETARKAT